MPNLLTSSFAAATVLGTGAAALWPEAGDSVAIIAWPGTSATRALEVVAESGGAILDTAWNGRIVLARSDAAGFARNLYASGAALVLRIDAAGCGSPASPRTGA